MSRYKLTWLTILMIALALFMTACGTTSKPPTERVKNGNLELVVQGVRQAQVMVAFDGKIIFDQVVHGSQKIESLKPGQYAVDGMPMQGVVDPTAQTVAIKPEETTKVILIYTQVQQPTNTPLSVAHLGLQAVQDEAGKALLSSEEINTVKDVMLYAAQTEESVCVFVKATGAQGIGVANAQLSVNVADDFPALDRVAIIRGCVKKDTLSLMSAATFLIGILPGYKSIGIFAPLLLVIARCAQGFSLGGEFGGASSFITEYAPDTRRGFFTSWTQVSALLGFAWARAISVCTC
jgi:hypothetical protein